MDMFTLHQSSTPAPVFATESESKRIVNAVGGADLFYGIDPTPGTPNDRIKAGESKVVTERVWLSTNADARVVIEPAERVG
jgi:hypothetical protein